MVPKDEVIKIEPDQLMGKFSMNSMSTTNSNIYDNYANLRKTVLLNQYDHYTNSDGILKNYESIYQGKGHSIESNGHPLMTTDDPIVNLIPKELFINKGIYSYIGLEYGFFIKTIQSYESDNICEFILFDISRGGLHPERKNDIAPFIEIRPVYSGIINYNHRRKIVHKSDIMQTDLALTNISVDLAVKNFDKPNIGDNNYNVREDYGNYISTSVVEAEGVGIKADVQKVNLGGLKIAVAGAKFISPTLKFIGSVATPLISAIEKSVNGYNPISLEKIYDLRKLATGKYTGTYVEIRNSNAESTINNYGKLPKYLKAELIKSEYEQGAQARPLLYKKNEDFFRLKYSFAQANSAINWDTLVATQISLDICSDSTTKLLWTVIGGVNVFDSVCGGSVDFFSERPEKSDAGEIEEGKMVKAMFRKGSGHVKMPSHTPDLGSYQDYYFTPNRTFEYTIEAFNEIGDSYFRVYDRNNDMISCSKDDVPGDYDDYDDVPEIWTSKVKVKLHAGQRYKIRASSYGYNAGSFDFIINKQKSIIEAYSDNLNSERVSIENDAIWYEFTAKKSSNYTFFTTGNSNTYLTLFDNNYNQMSFDDDSSSGMNARIDMFLIEGQKMRLKVNVQDMKSGDFNLFVNRQKASKPHPIIGVCRIRFDVSGGLPEFYRFTPLSEISQFYYNSTGGRHILNIYDSNMQLIFRKDLNAAEDTIEMKLVHGEDYYIRVKSVSNYGTSTGYISFGEK